MRNVAATLAFGLVAATLFTRLHAPLPWLVGPPIATALAHIALPL